MSGPVLERQTLIATPVLVAEVFGLRAMTPEFVNEAYAPRAQLAFPLAGVHYIQSGGDEVLLDLNGVALVPVGVTTRDRHPATGDMSCLLVTLRAGFLDELTRGKPAAAGLAAAACSLRPANAALQYATALAAASTDAPLEGLEERVAGMVGAVLQTAAPAEAIGARSLRLVRQVKALLHASSEPLSLSVIAAELDASPTYLTDLFRRAEGMPIYRYQSRLRLARSLRQLAASDDITGLALDLGFSSHSHFTTAFKAAFGVTPSAHRAAVRRRVVRPQPLRAA